MSQFFISSEDFCLEGDAPDGWQQSSMCVYFDPGSSWSLYIRMYWGLDWRGELNQLRQHWDMEIRGWGYGGLELGIWVWMYEFGCGRRGFGL